MVYRRKIKDPIVFKVEKACVSGADVLKGVSHHQEARGAGHI
jgi:hypothetical protein